VLEVLRPLGRRRHDRDRTVALEAEVVQAQRVGDHAGVEVVVERHRRPHERGLPRDGVVAGRDRDLGQVLALRPVQVHVALGEDGEHLPRAHEAGRADEVLLRRRRCRVLAPLLARCVRRAEPAQPRLLQRHVADDDLGHAARDRGRGQSDGAGRATATAGQHRGEAHLGDAERLRDQPGVEPEAVEREPVDVVRREPGVAERVEDRGAGELEVRLGQRAAPLEVLRRADSDDRRLVLQRVRHGRDHNTRYGGGAPVR
jgi:hypothetical protein